MNNTVLKSYAKINLFLKVGKKLKKTKLHNVQSLIYLIDLKDKILIKKNYKQKDIVKFTGKFNKNINKKYNSINKSLSLLRKKKFIKKKIGYEISIKKNIPVFSGLGGGSSNAASIIQYFLKGRKISKKDIDYFSKYLGSDLKIFFKSKRVFQKSLFTIVDFKKNYKFYFLLVYPFLKGSTKEIYSKLRKFEIIKNNNNYKKNSRTEFINELRLSDNSLEKIVVSKFPVVGKVLEEMRLIKNCQLSRVTGSGSACFALFLNKKDGAFALKQIKKKFPKFWCVLCKTI